MLDLVKNVLGPVAPDVAITEDVSAMRSMLATRAEKWNRQLREEGKLEGERAGAAAVLVRLLEHRFGALPDWARDRIATGESATLEEWSLRVLDAENLEDVLR